MRIRPHITLLTLLSVFTVLLFLSFVFYVTLPSDKENIKLFGITFTFPKPGAIFSIPEPYADITNIIQANASLSIDSVVSDTTKKILPAEVFDTVRANVADLNKTIRKLEFPKGQKDLLFKVFSEMDSAQIKGKVMRVVHYGDSQIEGDRMTSFLRNRLQSKFGGSGVGLVPARQVYDFRFSVFHDASENWNRYTLYGTRDTLIKHNRYGVLASFCNFTPPDAAKKSAVEPARKAWISVKNSPYSYVNTKKFSQCRLFYGHNEAPFKASLFIGNELSDSGTYPTSTSLKQIRWTFHEPIDNLKLEIEATTGPEIYALAFDGSSGIAVDNVAMRGCAGLVFTKMDPLLFKKMVEELNIKLMILQFGGNVVPEIRQNYDFYERWFYAQLNFIKTYAPQVEIIVIGVADMSMKKGDRYVSYPNIELVRDAMKKATHRAHAIYWDMYEAMGGKNSMPSWVFAQPPLAGKDFVHFNPNGAKIMANMFYNALMHEYARYVEHLKN